MIFKEYSLLIKMDDYFLFNKTYDYCFQVFANIKSLCNLIKMYEFITHFNLLNSIEMEFNHFNLVKFHYFLIRIIFHNEPITQAFLSKFYQLLDFCFIKHRFHRIFHLFLN